MMDQLLLLHAQRFQSYFTFEVCGEFTSMADSNIHRMKNSAETSVTVNVVFNYKNNERTQLQSPVQRAS